MKLSRSTSRRPFAGLTLTNRFSAHQRCIVRHVTRAMSAASSSVRNLAVSGSAGGGNGRLRCAIQPSPGCHTIRANPAAWCLQPAPFRRRKATSVTLSHALTCYADVDSAARDRVSAAAS